jgi:hypothetical protein
MSCLLKTGHSSDRSGSHESGAIGKAGKTFSLQLFRWKWIAFPMLLALFVFAVHPEAWSQKTPEKGTFLADRHKAAKVDCAQCHKDKPTTPVASAVCSGCHPNVAKGEKIRDQLPNPHNGHMSYPECSDCHHVHRSSENQCAGCHHFEFRMR